jgi:CIC family chloride channel protein
MPENEVAPSPPGSDRPAPAWDLVRATVLATVGGAAIGAVGAAFRLVLDYGFDLRGEVIEWAEHYPAVGWAVPVLAAASLVAAARWMVRRFAPEAGGSGVQHVEAVMRGEADPPGPPVLPVKFVGGAMSLGAGMALGREGPVVQMGSTVGVLSGRLARLRYDEIRDLQAAVAAAGLAAAFNAPIAGAVFAFEELARRFTPRVAVGTLAACAASVTVLRLLLGDHAEFALAAPAPFTVPQLLPYAGLAALLGVAGALYNWAIVRGLDLSEKAARVPPELRAAAVGAAVGMVAWLNLDLVGGGERQVQEVLAGQFTVAGLAVLFAVRWVMGPFSYLAGTPGGVFAPLLLVGASSGALFGEVLGPWVAFTPEPSALAVVGMAAFFTAVVRAPLTGVLLMVEMAATTQLVVPLLLAAAVATVVPTLLGSEPLYDTLRCRMLRKPSG